MKALKRAETAHEPTQHITRTPVGAPARRSASLRRQDLLRNTALWSVAALLMLGAGVYGYVLWSRPAPLVLTPGTAVLPAAPAASTSAEPTPVPADAPVQANPPEAATGASEATTPITTADAVAQAVPPVRSPSVAPPATAAAAAPRGAQIAIHASGDSSNSTLQRAYQALKAGRTAQARTLYLEALASDTGVDALLGLAAIAANNGEASQAAAYYREALLREPSNSAALAGIALLASSGDPQAAQKPLERMAEKTESASVRAALGNVYASQSKWQAAQQAYFEAFSKEPNNANLAYNLAVSLDQLGERNLALEYYRKALELGARGDAAYDPVSIERRIAELQPAN